MNKRNETSKAIQEELKELSPSLANIPKKQPYEAPEGYFEGLSTQASEMAKEIGVQRTPIIRRLVNVRSVAAAASILIIAMVTCIYNIDDDKEQMLITDASVDEMVDYLENVEDFGFDEEELVDELIECETAFDTEGYQKEGHKEITEDELTYKEIVDYLLEDNIDLATIIDELN